MAFHNFGKRLVLYLNECRERYYFYIVAPDRMYYTLRSAKLRLALYHQRWNTAARASNRLMLGLSHQTIPYHIYLKQVLARVK